MCKIDKSSRHTNSGRSREARAQTRHEKWAVFAKPMEKWIGNPQKPSVFVQGKEEREICGVFSYEQSARNAGEQSDHFSGEEENTPPSKPAILLRNFLFSRTRARPFFFLLFLGGFLPNVCTIFESELKKICVIENPQPLKVWVVFCVRVNER